ncbi:MAG: efflux transporter outer membrane subunit [Burkholderiales bacterium]|nr:MAG: efflux transporter outer membrane subunit [Burkholderiales bacterium]
MRALITVALVGALAGCGAFKVGPDYAGAPAARSLSQAEAARGTATPTAGAPARPTAAADDGWQARLPHGGASADLAAWWSQFDDPTLDALLAAAQRESGSLAQAAARIEQARAAAIAAGAGGLPTLDLNLANSRGTINIGTSVLLATQNRATLQAGWEIDLFGRIAREREASLARLDARTAEWHDARVSVAAETAAQYLQYRYCEALVAIAQADAASRAETARVTDRAAAAGFQAPAAAALTRASAAEAAGRLTGQRAECDLTVKALVALTGLAEPDVRARLAAAQGRLPTPRAFEVKAVPAGLLAQRPDLAAAERSLAAASADIGSAEGDRYPRLSLVGSVGPLRIDSGQLGATLSTWSIGPSLTLPIFDGGRRLATVESARAAYVAAEADYRTRARQAVREVEEALVRLQSAADREGDARTAAAGYRSAVEAAQIRWKGGLGSLLELEESRRYALAADSTLAGVQRDRVAAWVSLYRALGGGWMNTNEDSRK